MSCSVTLRNVGCFANGTPLFQNVSLTVGHKEKVAVIGPNGCGKTTLLKIVAGLARPDAGSVELFHRPMHTEKEFREGRRDLGFLFQDSDDQFLCPTVLEDVMFGLRVRGADRAKAREKAEAMLHSLGIGHLAGRIALHLSGGEKKLSALAGTLVTDPKVLLLDEPTTGLDDEAQERLLFALAAVDKSMIIVSHHREFVRNLAQRVYRLTPEGVMPA